MTTVGAVAARGAANQRSACLDRRDEARR